MATNNGRKFNIGRQGEQLMNEEFHKLFMTLKFLNYDRYINEDYNLESFGDKKERQAEIPNHALRFKKLDDLNIIQTYDEKLDLWSALFEGYFHPANAKKHNNHDIISPYQLSVDENGVLWYFDPNVMNGASNGMWVQAQAQQVLEMQKPNIFSGVNFQLINDLQKVQSSGGSSHYPVPYIPFGKLFSGKNAVPFTTEEGLNNCGIITDKTDLSWVHVNARKLKKIDRRLIKINLDLPEEDRGYINITSAESEFYGFKPGGIFGELLFKGEDKDFIDRPKGIKLTYNAMNTYKYVYAITYIFDDRPTHEGSVIQKYKTINGSNEVYIGDGIADNIALFVDGLSLEKKGYGEAEVGEYDIYIHHEEDGTIEFLDNEDAEIINQMKMTALIFPDRTEEFIISASDDLDPDTNVVKIKLGDTLYELENRDNIMAFCSGLGLRSIEIQKDIAIEDDYLIINNFTLQTDEQGNDIEYYSCFLADVGTSLVCEGMLTGNKIEHEDIQEGKQYVVFVNGLLMTPSNGDIKVNNKYIELHNAEDALHTELNYIVFEADDMDESKIGVVYDNDVSYFSVRIDDSDPNVTYDNCNCAIVYAAASTNGGAGILLDEAAVEMPLNPAEGFYKGNQIIRSTDNNGNHTYYIHDFTKDAPTQLEDGAEIEAMISYYANSGSIQLIGNGEQLAGYQMRYFAYTYANMIDEPLLIGRRTDLDTMIVGKDFDKIYRGTTARRHGWKVGFNSLSTYINGVIVPHNELMIDSETEEVNKDAVGVTRTFEIERPVLDMKQTSYYGDKKILEVLDCIYDMYGNLIKKRGFILESNKKKISWYEDELDAETDFRTVKTEEEVLYWSVGDGIVKDYFTSLELFVNALELAVYMNENLENECVSYIVENPERDEYMAAHRDYIYLETNDKTTNHKQIYRLTNDAIETDFVLAPGTVNVYVNGILLDDSEYCKFDNNKILFNTNVCGVQQLPDNKEGCLSDSLSERDMEEFKYLYKNEPKRILRIIEDKPYYIPVSDRDTILIERRDDTSIKKLTYEVDLNAKLSGNGVLSFKQGEYDIPESLMSTIDHIKIYINGVYYDGGYVREYEDGKFVIKLTQINESIIKVDPIDDYLKLEIRDSVKRFEYKEKLGLNKKRLDKITFEWR